MKLQLIFFWERGARLILVVIKICLSAASNCCWQLILHIACKAEEKRLYASWAHCTKTWKLDKDHKNILQDTVDHYSKPWLIRIRFDQRFYPFRRRSGLTEDVVSCLTSSRYWDIGENYLNWTHLRPNSRLSQKQKKFWIHLQFYIRLVTAISGQLWRRWQS